MTARLRFSPHVKMATSWIGMVGHYFDIVGLLLPFTINAGAGEAIVKDVE